MSTTFNKKPSANQWLPGLKPNPQAKVRLFCFPYAGGGTQIYHKWQTELPSTVEVRPVQLPGRGSRIMDAPYTQLTDLVRAVCAGILPQLQQQPFMFFGHSMGAMISFELARLLRREYALQPLHLFVAGRTAPQVPPSDPPSYNLPDPEFLDHLHQLNGTPKELLANEELMQLMLPLLRADFEVCQTYTYIDEPPLECPITVYGGMQDKHVSLQQYEAWKEQTSAQFLLRMFPGDHFFIHSDQKLLLETLAKELDQLVNKEFEASPKMRRMS